MMRCMQSWPRIILVALLSCAGALAQSVRMPDGEVAPISDTQPPQALLKDGTRLIGVDMRWYTSATPDEQPLIEDDEAQIRQILQIRDSGTAPCEHVRELLDMRLAEVDEQIAELGRLREIIAQLRTAAEHVEPETCQPGAVCAYL